METDRSFSLTSRIQISTMLTAMPVPNPRVSSFAMTTVLRLNIWSGPRNVSTALMYAFAQRADTCVIDEPLYGHYLRVSGAKHPGAREVMAHMDCDGENVIRNIVLGPSPRPVLFMKQMAHHLVEIDRDFFNHTHNILLTRDPIDMLPSLANQLATPTLRDTGYKMQAELLQTFRAIGQNYPVLDARELLKNPQRVLAKLCDALNLPFDPAMLTWQAGPRPEDGIWAKHWYHNVHKSTRFQPYRPKPDPFPEHLRPLLNTCQPHYDQLYAHAIKAE